MTVMEAGDSVKVAKPVPGITVITIDRQKRRNAVDADTARKLYDAVLEFEEDADQKVCLLANRSSVIVLLWVRFARTN